MRTYPIEKGPKSLSNYTAQKYIFTMLALLFMIGIMAVSDARGYSKLSRSSVLDGYNASSDTYRAPSEMALRSSSVLVEDQKTGEFLFQKNVNAVMPIASITKLMTAMVVLDAHMDLQEPLIIKSEDVDNVRRSRSHLQIGTQLTREEALLLSLMASENRAANALSRVYPGEQPSFIEAMNAKARSLGLSITRFTDPTGLSSTNISSAYDLAKMVDAAYRYPLIRQFTTTPNVTIKSGHRILTFHNTNRLIRSSCWQIGLSKTGFIDEAGQCLVMQANVCLRPILIVLLDSQGKLTRFGDANRIKRPGLEPQPA